MLILGLESSCDETSVALLEAKKGKFVLHKNFVSSQIKIHKQYGGIVPEVAARHHVEIITPLVKEAIKDVKKIDIIAVTAGPGLATALLVGVETARALAYLWKKPLVAVNHLAGHIYANWLPNPLPPPYSKGETRELKFPILCLIVSGGHTELVLMKKHLDYQIVGETRDDAVGECFDKVGKILGLPYPGGPEVAKHATLGNPQAIKFPRPMLDSTDLDFSFSGLKTAVLYYVKTMKPASPAGRHLNNETINNICASFEQAAIDVLVAKTIRAAKKNKVKTLLLGGGVAANQNLQSQLQLAINQSLLNTKYLTLNSQYCGDNAAMIAAAGYFKALKKQFTPWDKLDIDPNWELR